MDLFAKHDLLTRVAWKYYKEELTQQEIADSLEISRFKVMSLLDEAREEGIIEINIKSPVYNCLSLEQEFNAAFDLDDVYIIPTPKSPDNMKKIIGKAGGSYLSNVINSGDEIGTAWGETLYEAANNFSPDEDKDYNDISFVWLRGGLSSGSLISINHFDVARTLAEKTDGRCYYVFAPARVETEEAKNIIMSDIKVSEALAKAREVNKAIIGIGETTSKASLVKSDLIKAEEMEELNKKGAVGDILGRFFDIDGKPIETEINDMMIGIELEELKSIEKVIAFAGGENKVESVYGALKGEYLDVLVTDEETARKVLEY